MAATQDQLFDRSKTQAVVVKLSNGMEGTFYGPLQFDQETVDDNTIVIVDVKLSDPSPMSNGISWMLEGPKEGK